MMDRYERLVRLERLVRAASDRATGAGDWDEELRLHLRWCRVVGALGDAVTL